MQPGVCLEKKPFRQLLANTAEKEVKIICTVFTDVCIKMVQHHDSVPSLNCTAISIDSPHMHRDGANYLNLLLKHMPVQCTLG